MILPTPEFDPLFALDGEPFRDKMLHYIAEEFADTLGDRSALLFSDEGLDILQTIVGDRIERGMSGRRAAG